MNQTPACLGFFANAARPLPRPRHTGLIVLGALLVACAATARAATNAVPGLVFHLTFDELRNGAFLDVTTSNAVGRATNARVASPGKLAGACEFSAKNSYIEVPDSPALSAKAFTVSVWFKNGREAWVSRYLLDKDSERGYSLSIAGGGKENARKGKLRASVGGQSCLSDSTVNDDIWHHAAVTFDGQGLKLYVDGVQQQQTAGVPGGLPPNTHSLTLGMHRSSPSSQDKDVSFDGQLDELMLFNRVLDTNELKRVRSAAKPKFTKWQVERRLKELKDLLDRGLILQDFYDRKVDECEVVE